MLSNQQSVNKIRDMFKAEKGYGWASIPAVLVIDNGAVLANMAPSYNPEHLFESLQSFECNKYLTACNKLKADGGYGDWEISVRIIHSDYFESREQCDDFFSNERDISEFYLRKYGHLERISIDDVFETFSVEVTANLDYYLNGHMDELAEDLDRPISATFLSNATGDDLKLLSQELYYKLMCKMFGESPEDEAETSNYAESSPIQTDGEHQGAARGMKQVMLKDCRMLTRNGNDIEVTAMRGEYYILFLFDSL